MTRDGGSSREYRPPSNPHARKAFYRALGIESVVRLLRSGDYDALQEFNERHVPLLLNYAERAGIVVADLETVARDVLSDVAVALIAMRAGLPRCAMETYVVRCFRNRLFSIQRESAHDAAGRGAVEQLEEGTSGLWRTGCSEATIRATIGPDWERTRLSPAIEKLSTMLDEGLSREERDLLASVSEYASQSEIAEWLGMSHAAVRKQLERLRKRLTIVARRYTEALTGADRAEIRRFFRRVAAIIGGDPPSPPNDSTRAAG